MFEPAKMKAIQGFFDENFKSIKGDVIRVEISMGCKQPEACYANKKQNFLVRAGRQCFPKNSMSSTLAYGIDSVSVSSLDPVVNLKIPVVGRKSGN